MAGRRTSSRRAVLGGVGAVSAAALAATLGLRPRAGDVLDGRGPNAPLPFVTPTERFYKFANGPWPAPADTEAPLSLSGAGVSRTLPWRELLDLPTERVLRTIACDGNGYLGDRAPRSMGCEVAGGFDPEEDSAHPPPREWTWRFGGIGNAEWDVLTLEQLFTAARVPMDGSHLRLQGRDGYLRWFPREQARDLLVAVGMNGQPLPHEHGAPARLLASGQYGAMSVKWLTSIAAGSRTGSRPWDGGSPERFPVKPVAFASAPLDGAEVPRGRLTLTGAAYAGPAGVKDVLFGPPGEDPRPARLLDPPRPHVWSRWEAAIELPEPGDVVLEIACSATDGRYSMPQSAWGDAEGWGGIYRLHLTVV